MRCILIVVSGIFVGAVESNFGFSHDGRKLVDVGAFVKAAETHSLPCLGVSVPFKKLVEMFPGTDRHTLGNTGKLAKVFTAVV